MSTKLATGPSTPPDASRVLRRVRMAPKLAYCNLFHDKLSLAVTLVGIVFSVLLMAVQCGIYLGTSDMIAAVIDKTDADIWVMAGGIKTVDDPSPLEGNERFAVLSTPGVAQVEDLIITFASWRKPQGGSQTVLVVGSDMKGSHLRPWNLKPGAGSIEALAAPMAVAVDETYFKDLGIGKLGDQAEINKNRITVSAVTQGIRTFTTMPFVFTNLVRAKAIAQAGPDQSAKPTYLLAKVKPGADIETVRKAIATRLPTEQVLTKAEFRFRSIDYWMNQTGAGLALIAGAFLGLIVGIVVVAQTLYSSTKDHLNEFATLRAMGASASYIHRVILTQALLSAVVGYAVGMALSLITVHLIQAYVPELAITMTTGLALALLAVTVSMCALAALSAIFKVTRIDPAGVFSR